jgi:S-adenosylmethionine hydrolase
LVSNYICLKTNFIQARILAKISPLTCFQSSHILSTNFDDSNKNTLFYNGRVNIENFSVKIIDTYGNILLSINEDYCFEIEFECEELTSTNNSIITLSST